MMVDQPTRRGVRFGIAQLLGAVAVCGVIFAIVPHLRTPPSPLENLPLVKQGMSQEEVDSLIGGASTFSHGGLYRCTNGYADDRHLAEVEFVRGRVVEVWMDGKLISPPEPPDDVWADKIAEQLEKDTR
jgi:hypothetical protein